MTLQEMKELRRQYHDRGINIHLGLTNIDFNRWIATKGEAKITANSLGELLLKIPKVWNIP